MKIFFKNLGVVLIFLGIAIMLLLIGEGFKIETFVYSMFSFALGISLFIINKK